ncbi:MAG: hypothetical protein [Caudoviricetes sp.]|nr:MAG: hypothetical protein [Caudoviricetes sp.]
MKLKCKSCITPKYSKPDVIPGKEYHVLYVENKNFLEYDAPYIEFINEQGHPIGWAPCDTYITWEENPTTEQAMGVEAKVPNSMRHLIDPDYEYMEESDYYEDSK